MRPRAAAACAGPFRLLAAPAARCAVRPAAAASAAARRPSSSSSAAAAAAAAAASAAGRDARARGAALEARVAGLLSSSGHPVRRNVLLRDAHGNLSEVDVVYGWLLPVYVECKAYAPGSPVPLEDVAKFLAVLRLNGVALARARALFVTTSTFSPRARTLGARLVDGAGLERWESRVRARVAAGRAAAALARAAAVLLAAALALAPDALEGAPGAMPHPALAAAAAGALAARAGAGAAAAGAAAGAGELIDAARGAWADGEAAGEAADAVAAAAEAGGGPPLWLARAAAALAPGAPAPDAPGGALAVAAYAAGRAAGETRARVRRRLPRLE